MTRISRVAPRPGWRTFVMPTGSPGRISEPCGPSRSADSESTVTRVLRSKAELLYMRRVMAQPASAALAPPVTSGRPKLHAANLDGNPDPFGGESTQDTLSKLVLNQELVGERLHVADECEIERVLTEARNEPGRRLRLRQETRHLVRRLRRFFHEDSLDQVGIGAVVHGVADEQRQPRLRQVVVGDD